MATLGFWKTRKRQMTRRVISTALMLIGLIILSSFLGQTIITIFLLAATAGAILGVSIAAEYIHWRKESNDIRKRGGTR